VSTIVLDVEIAKRIEELPDGWNATAQMGVGVCCIWHRETSEMQSVVGADQDRQKLQELRDLCLDPAITEIVTWNGVNFDYPVIFGISRQAWLDRTNSKVQVLRKTLLKKSNDVLRRCWLGLQLNPDRFAPRTHGGWSLDAVAKAMLQKEKNGEGRLAPVWYQEGQIDRVVNYCSTDVHLTNEIDILANHLGYVLGARKRSVLAPKFQ